MPVTEVQRIVPSVARNQMLPTTRSQLSGGYARGYLCLMPNAGPGASDLRSLIDSYSRNISLYLGTHVRAVHEL